MKKLIRAHVIVTGKVQGVFYRATASEEARMLGLTGWIRNRPDGSIEAVFEGPEEKVKKMVDWCDDGPEFAEVEKVDAKYEKYKGEFSDFRRL